MFLFNFTFNSGNWILALRKWGHVCCVCSPGVCGRQRAVCGSCYDLEGGAESVEATRWELRGAGGELQQTCQFFLCEGWHNCPEPLHDLKNRRIRINSHCHPLLWSFNIIMWTQTILYKIYNIYRHQTLSDIILM